LTTLPGDDQDVLYRAAIIAVEDYCGQSFDFWLDTQQFLDGSGTRTLYLPMRVETLHEIEVSHSGLEAAFVHLSEKGDRIIVNADAGIGNYYERTMMDIQDDPPLKFTYGADTVRVVADWGYTDFPQAVFDALRIDMEDQALSDTNALSQTLRAFRKLGLRQIDQGNLTANISRGAMLSDRVAQILQPFIWYGKIGVTV